jgi:hypothetical protein
MERSGEKPWNSGKAVTPFQSELIYHFHIGTGNGRRPWSPPRFASKVDRSEQAVRNWIRGLSLPEDLEPIVRAFGPDLTEAERLRLCEAYHLTKGNRDSALSGDPVIPPVRCFGREKDADDLIAALTASFGVAVAVLGPPGIGKTTLSRQVASNPQIIARFKKRRWLVELQAATDTEALRTAIIRAVGLDPALTHFRDVLRLLNREPSLLVLNHLDGPWELDRAEVENCLSRIAALPAVTMLVSLLGTEVPSRPDFACQRVLGPLAPDPAKDFFLRRAPRIKINDPDLKPLLRELDGFPAAIELVACWAAPYSSLRDVREQWRRHGMGLATHPELPGEQLTAIIRSFRRAWQSPRLGEEGRRLFGLLSQRPAGMSRPDRARLMGDDAGRATRQLLATGLASPYNGDRLKLPRPMIFVHRLIAALAHSAMALDMQPQFVPWSATYASAAESNSHVVGAIVARDRVAPEDTDLRAPVTMASPEILNHDSTSYYFRGLIDFPKELNYPLRVFTLNYDKLLEYADLGNKNFCLYKLHGSIDWSRPKSLGRDVFLGAGCSLSGSK